MEKGHVTCTFVFTAQGTRAGLLADEFWVQSSMGAVGGPRVALEKAGSQGASWRDGASGVPVSLTLAVGVMDTITARRPGARGRRCCAGAPGEGTRLSATNRSVPRLRMLGDSDGPSLPGLVLPSSLGLCLQCTWEAPPMAPMCASSTADPQAGPGWCFISLLM